MGKRDVGRAGLQILLHSLAEGIIEIKYITAWSVELLHRVLSLILGLIWVGERVGGEPVENICHLLTTVLRLRSLWVAVLST